MQCDATCGYEWTGKEKLVLANVEDVHDVKFCGVFYLHIFGPHAESNFFFLDTEIHSLIMSRARTLDKLLLCFGPLQLALSAQPWEGFSGYH